MRTIMGFCGTCSDITDFTKGLTQAAPRGHGENRIVDVGCGLLGYHRHASGEHPAQELQPLTLDGSYAVCSGELIGYGGLRASLQARGYTFRSRCDCELLLPLYREYGVKMFGMLNGEFALILFDHRSGHFIAARDSAGQRPLYYGQDDAGNTVFASDAASLIGLCRRVQPFPPGHYYEDGRFIRYDDSVGAA